MKASYRLWFLRLSLLSHSRNIGDLFLGLLKNGTMLRITLFYALTFSNIFYPVKCPKTLLSPTGTAVRYGIQTYPFSTLGGGDRRRHRNEGIFALLIFWSLAFHILIQQAVTVFTQFTTFHTCVVYQKNTQLCLTEVGYAKFNFDQNTQRKIFGDTHERVKMKTPS